MSLILEALRKSEAERRRAQAPDLFAERSPTKARAVATSPRWLAWALAAVVALLLTGWLARGLLEASPETVAVETAPAPSREVSPPRASSVEASSPAGTRRPQKSAPAAAAVEVTRPAPPMPVAAAPAPALALASEPPTITDEVNSANTAPAPERIEGAVATSSAEPPPVTVRAPTYTPTAEVPFRLADLSSEERRQLPTLKMSMHLWHAVSAQRFVILDGERMGEGDRIGDAVIDEITRDGVLLAWQGRRLRLPIQ